MGKYAKKCTSLSKCKDRGKRKYLSAKIRGGGQKKKYFSETEKHKREKCNPSEYFFPGGVFF